MCIHTHTRINTRACASAPSLLPRLRSRKLSRDIPIDRGFQYYKITEPRSSIKLHCVCMCLRVCVRARVCSFVRRRNTYKILIRLNKVNINIYRVYQEERSIFLEVIVSVILSKKLYMNICPIPNDFRDRAI